MKLSRRWTVACWAGFCILFLAFFPSQLIEALRDPEAWKVMAGTLDPAQAGQGVDRAAVLAEYRFNVAFHFVHFAAFGALLGWLQSSILTRWLRRRLPWIGLTSLGFVALLLFEFVRPGIVTGGHPAPIEPILIAFGGGSLAGILQSLYLRRQGFSPGKWLGFWVGGLACGVVAAIVVLTLVGPALEPIARETFDDRTTWLVGQVIFFSLYGSVVGAVAGLMSGRAVLSIFPVAEEAPEGQVLA